MVLSSEDDDDTSEEVRLSLKGGLKGLIPFGELSILAIEGIFDGDVTMFFNGRFIGFKTGVATSKTTVALNSCDRLDAFDRCII